MHDPSNPSSFWVAFHQKVMNLLSSTGLNAMAHAVLEFWIDSLFSSKFICMMASLLSACFLG
jgi:hypothetical protein